MPWVRRLSGTFQAMMVGSCPPFINESLSKLVYFRSMSTVTPTIVGVVGGTVFAGVVCGLLALLINISDLLAESLAPRD